jgi:His-Xaa-Ser system protein HxsD
VKHSPVRGFMHSSAGLFAIHDNVLSVDLNESVYSRDAVLRTAYWFTDRCYLYIARPSPGLFRVQFKPKAPKSDLVVETLEEVAGEFLNSLLDHQIRHDIESQTGRIRELLVAKAFAEAGALEDTPPGDPGDPVDKVYQREGGFVHIEPTS